VEPNKTFVDVNIASNAASTLLAVIDRDVIFLPAIGRAFNITFQILTGSGHLIFYQPGAFSIPHDPCEPSAFMLLNVPYAGYPGPNIALELMTNSVVLLLDSK